jgi:cytochrome c-type biogenesis protein CcmH/NrfG
MEPTTVTTIFMILFAIGVTALAIYGWFGSWDAAVRTLSPEDPTDREIEAAVLELRRAIRDYERGS